MKHPMTMAAMFAGALALSGCATQTGWTPTVDYRNDPNPDRVAIDQSECSQLAQQAAGNQTERTVRGGLFGGALGAATGAAIGAATGGSAGEGAAVGAAIGGIGAGAHEALSADEQYKRAFITCMRNRGHNVIN